MVCGFSAERGDSGRRELLPLAPLRPVPAVLLRGHRLHLHHQPQLRVLHLLSRHVKVHSIQYCTEGQSLGRPRVSKTMLL